MITELEFHEYGKVKPFFTGVEFDLLLSAILEGNSLAQIWVDDRTEPSSIFLWDEANNVFYLSGEGSNEQFNEEITKVLSREIVPKLMLRNRLYFRLRATSDSWDKELLTIFVDANIVKEQYIFHSHGKPVSPNWRKNIPSGFILEKIDEGFINDPDYVNKEFVLGEIRQMWPSIDRFVKFGFGFSIVTEGRVVCWCTSEYVSKGKCGIGIETLQEYQRRGLATITASAFVERCKDECIKPYWECNAENIASKRVAEKIGFTKELVYPVYSGKFGP
jgi:GNAT superfamily N-acetyltransferase